MGYQDILVAYSPEGYNQLLSRIKTMEELDYNYIVDLFSNNSTFSSVKHCVSEDGCHIFAFSCVQTYAKDMVAFIHSRLHDNNYIDQDEFLMMTLGEFGQEIIIGNFYSNPFDMMFIRRLGYNVYAFTQDNSLILPKKEVRVNIWHDSFFKYFSQS